MPKYRTLNHTELNELEKEFVDYLVVSGIDADMWIKIKEDSPAKAVRIIELFSDVVFEKILRKTKYIFKVENTTLFLFHYAEEMARLMIFQFPDGFDLKEKTQQEIIAFVKANRMQSIPQSKKFIRTREEELFSMLQAGCDICPKTFYESMIKQE